MPYYIESSALVKLVIQELGSKALREWYSSHQSDSVSSELTVTEVIRAVRRITPELLSNARGTLASTTIILLTTEMFERAAMLDPLTLRSLDALHLACALSLGPDLEGLVTYDARLSEAAQSVGIRTLAPM